MNENTIKNDEPLGLRPRLYLVLAATWPMAFIPLRLGLEIGAFLGYLAFSLIKWRSREAVENIERAKAAGFLPASLDAKKTAKDAYKNMGRSGWEAIRYLHRGLSGFQGHWVVNGGENFFKALEEGREKKKGLILGTIHSGSWEVSCNALPYLFGCKLTIVGRSQGSPLVDALIKRLRTKEGNEFVFKSGEARAMLTALRQGGVLATLVDQAAVTSNEGALIRFMNQPAWANLGPVKLARRTGAPILLVLLRRRGIKKFFDVPPLLEPSGNPDKEAAIMEDLQNIQDLVADYIRQYPDQWMWGHKRWKLPSERRLSEEDRFRLAHTDWRQKS